MAGLRTPALGLAGLVLVATLPLQAAATAEVGPRQEAPATARAGTAARPAVRETRTIGRTVKGRSIVAWRLGDPSAKRKVVALAAMHGDEAGPSRVLVNLRDGKPVRGVDLWVVPFYNPDGLARRTRQNAHGVDLNRNFPRHWQRAGGQYASGPRAGSEPETKAVMAFLRRVRPNYVISFHQPLRGVGRAPAKGSALVRRLHRHLGLPVRSFNCTGTCHGTMTEWFNATHPGVAVTVEYGRGLSRRQASRTGPDGLLAAVGARR